MARIAFEDISKTYPNGHRALERFNLQVSDGELIVLVGPSGCGKSTVLRLLAGLELANAGHIRIDDSIVDDWSPQTRNVAMVFQDYALYPTMTVRANLAFPLRMRKLPTAEIERRVRWAAELLALGDVLDRLPKQLSGGQRQRVAMGRALVREPTVFLLDEPLSNLDAQLRTQVRAEIVDLQRRTGSTMIYVTHDQVEAMTMGQRIAVLSDGVLKQAGSPQTLYDAPTNAFVAGFIGTPPMNLIPIEVFEAAWRGQPDSGDDSETRALRAIVRDPRCRWVGIRPEHVAVGDRCGKQLIKALVIEIEYLGHESLVHFSFPKSGADGSQPVFVARLAGALDCHLGDWIDVGFVQEKLMGFDRDQNRIGGR